MDVNIRIGDRSYQVGAKPIDISIPLRFNGEQPNAYGVQKAVSRPVVADDLIGDTRRGGSCNFDEITLIPHCNGTHTECVGHITHERISLRDHLHDVFIPAVLVSAEPVSAAASGEQYAVALGDTDELITQRVLEAALGMDPDPPAKALIVRTLPNDESKMTREYSDVIPPYFSTEAMQFIVERRFTHLLVDTPSIDRLFDEGKLANHRIFWNVEAGNFEINGVTRIRSTITELIFVPDIIDDGEYLLNLQIAPFASDASPSRPLLFRPTGST